MKFLIGHTITWCGAYSGKTEVHPLLKERDARADDLAHVSLRLLEPILSQKLSKPELAELKFVVLTTTGCSPYIQKVLDGVKNLRPRQGQFTRCGYHTIGTFTATGLQSHGGILSMLVSDMKDVKSALVSLGAIINPSEPTCILFADRHEQIPCVLAVLVNLKVDTGSNRGFISAVEAADDSMSFQYFLYSTIRSTHSSCSEQNPSDSDYNLSQPKNNHPC